MFSVGFNRQGLLFMSDYYHASLTYGGISLFLYPGTIPDELPVYGNEDPKRLIDGVEPESNAIYRNAIASYHLQMQQKVINDEIVADFVPDVNYPIAYNGWDKVGSRWERGYDWAILGDHLTAAPRIGAGSSALTYAVTDSGSSLIYEEDSAGSCNPYFELNFDNPTTLEGVDFRVHGVYTHKIEYWDSGTNEWVLITTYAPDNTVKSVKFDAPITTTKFRFVGDCRDSSQFFRIYYVKFWSETEPSFNPLVEVTHAILTPSYPPFNRIQAFDPRNERPMILMDVSDITGNGAVKLLDTMVGDMSPPQFMSCAFKVEELFSD